MGKCLAEIAHSMKRNNGMTRLLLVLCILCFGGGKMLCSYMKTMGQANEKFEKTYLEQNIYPVASLFDGGYEDYEKPENYGKLLQWYEVMNESNVLTYVESNQQYFTKSGGGENEYHDGLYVGRNYFEEFPAELAEGRLFEEDEFIYEDGKCMPIILGAAYAGEFELGEHFLADTVLMQTEVCVVGFLKKGELLCQRGIMTIADDYIFFPMIDFLDRENIEETDPWLMYMKINGVVKTGMSKPEAQEYLYHISDRLGILEQIAQGGTLVLLVTHDGELAKRCSNLLVLGG